MKHYLINLTWRCQNSCSYCWVRQSVRQRPELTAAPERPLADWVAALRRDPPDLVDIAGGEPLLVPWLMDLFVAAPNVRFGLSSNGLAHDRLMGLLERRPANLIALNISYHPETAASVPRYTTLWRRTVYAAHVLAPGVHCNVVAAPGIVDRAGDTIKWLQQHGIHHEVSPYEEVAGLGVEQPVGLCCRGGIDHLTIAPDGSAWPCLTTLRSPYWRERCLGNWIDNTLDLSRRIQPCHLDCVDYFVLPKEHAAGDMWGIRARPCEMAP